MTVATITPDTETTAGPRLEDADFEDWIVGLRSEEYGQGKNMLCDEDGRYCCLGVLAERDGVNMFGIVPGTLTTNWGRASGTGAPFQTPAILNRLPLDVRYLVAEANDAGITFAEIADALEEHRSIVQAGADAHFPGLDLEDWFPHRYEGGFFVDEVAA